MSFDFERTLLWESTLAARSGDHFANERDRLRTALLSLRANAALAGQSIRQLLPELTVHDVTHADALWGIGSEIVGKEIAFNPVEAFVLGAAFYIHDLALGLAGFPEGPDALRASPDVRTALAARLFRNMARWPTEDELDEADKADRDAALFTVLRRQHADRAERLLTVALPHPDETGQINMLDNQDLRDRYGEMIGIIAQSHGWEVERLGRTLEEPRGGPGWAPQWGVDRLNVACVLRLADAAHLDERRAPSVLQSLTGPMPTTSRLHWTFQSRLQPVSRKGDRLRFTSATKFPADEARAWWLCYEALRMVDRELRQVDAMLSDLSRPRLAARSVAGVDAPARLTEYIETHGWEPIDAQIHVVDVPRLVTQLGGVELYGKDVSVPLRELIQNGADAVSARRICEDRDESYGLITVRLGAGEEPDGAWIEIEDNGLGMSVDVLQRFLLSFGTSYWSSQEIADELPKLTRRGFVSTGRYGIGFFSVFMWGNHVRVSTRRFDHGHADTRVLEFDAGVGHRPTIREASEGERLRDGGTRVRVWLEPTTLEALLRPRHTSPEGSAAQPPLGRLAQVCDKLAPALGVSIDVAASDERFRVLTGGDWLTIAPEKLSGRTAGPYGVAGSPLQPDVLCNEDGTVTGRAALLGGGGVAVVGGLRATDVSHISGVLTATPVRAARDLCVPLASRGALARWATQQADRAVAAELPPEALLELARTVRSLGGSVVALPVAAAHDGLLGVDEVVARLRSLRTIRLLQDAGVSRLVRETETFVPAEDVLIVGMTASIMIQHTHGGKLMSWPASLTEGLVEEARGPTMIGVIIEAAGEAWNVSPADVVLGHEMPGAERPVGTRDGTPVSESLRMVMRPGSREAVAYETAQKAMALIYEHKSRTNAELVEQLGVSSAVLARALKPYAVHGWVKKVKGGYELPQDDSPAD